MYTIFNILLDINCKSIRHDLVKTQFSKDGVSRRSKDMDFEAANVGFFGLSLCQDRYSTDFKFPSLKKIESLI